MDNWEVAYVMPSLNLLKKPFEYPFESPIIAIAPYGDERVQDICKKSTNAKMLINGFVDSYKRKVEPAVLLVSAGAPKDIWNNEALVSFRNIVALSMILRAWADVQPGDRPNSPIFSNSFDFHPCALDKDGVLCHRTPAIGDIHPVDEPFLGMPDINVPTTYLSPVYDKFIYSRLLKLWKKAFINPGHSNYNSRKIFRSIETAYHALSVPVKNQSLFDVGVNISLWVSSLEILAHRKNEGVNQTVVLDLIKEHDWKNKTLAARRYKVKISKKNIRANLAQKLYKELYDKRNDFLHGNKVTPKSIYVFNNKNSRYLFEYAPIVYRTALSASLKKVFPVNLNAGLSSDLIESSWYERYYEDCLLRLIKKEES